MEPAERSGAHLTGPLAMAFAASIVVVSGVNLVYPVLPNIAADLGIEQSRVGLVIAAFALPAVFLAPVFGVLADMYGRRWLLICGLVVFSLAGIASSFVPDFEWLLAMRVIQGVGVSALSPLTVVLISDICQEREHELQAQGWKVAIDRVAIIVLPILGGALALHTWRASFVPYVLILPLAIVAYVMMPETRPPGRVDLGRYVRDILVAVRDSRVTMAFAVGFLRFFFDYGFFVFLPLLLALRYEASSVVSGGILAATAAGAIVTAVTVRRLSALASLEALLVAAFLISAVGIAFILMRPPLWAIPLATFAIGLGNGLISPLQKSMITRSAPAFLRGGVISCDRMVQQVAKSLSPALLGLLLIAAPIESVMVSLIAICLLGTAMMAWVWQGTASAA